MRHRSSWCVCVYRYLRRAVASSEAEALSQGGGDASGGVPDGAWGAWVKDWLSALAKEGRSGSCSSGSSGSSVAADGRRAEGGGSSGGGGGGGGSGGGRAAAAVAAAARLRRANPKYVAREWMLVQAYDAAASGDYGPVRA